MSDVRDVDTSRSTDSPIRERTEPNVNFKPFQLEITPEKLIIPPNGELEVSIKNPTQKKLQYWFSSNSFYFDFEFKDECKCFDVWRRIKKPLGPGETSTFTIKLREKTDPTKDMRYEFKNPEGYFEIAQEDYFVDDRRHRLNGAKKEFNLIIEEETEPIKKLKEEFLEIRKIQNRQKRWNEMEPKDGLPAYDDNFRDWDDPRDDKIREINLKICDYPKNLEEIDNMTDGEVKEMKKKRRDELIKEYEKYTEEEGVKSKVAKYERTKAWERKQREEDQAEFYARALKNAERKRAQARAVAEAKKKVDVKPVEVKPVNVKPVEIKPVEEPKKSVAQKPSEIKKPVEKVEVKEESKNLKSPVVAKKQMKKKKKNPCCVVM